MKTKYIFTFFLLIIYKVSFAQNYTYIQSISNTGILNLSDRGMIPVFAENDEVYCFTIASTSNGNRFQLMKVNSVSNQPSVIGIVMDITPTNITLGPRNFKRYGDYLYFQCGVRLFRLNTVTGNITVTANIANTYYLFKNFIIYSDNISDNKTYIRNLNNNVTTELKVNVNGLLKSFTAPQSFYEINNHLYFCVGQYIIARLDDLGQLSTVYVGNPIINSNDLDDVIRKQINDNLVYLIEDNPIVKFISINTITGTVNSSFNFDTLATNNGYTLDLNHEPFVIGNNIYMIDYNENVYVSDGVNQPQLNNVQIPGSIFSNYWGILEDNNITFNNETYFILQTLMNGNYSKEVWKTNGTSNPIIVTNNQLNHMNGFYWWPFIYNNHLYFSYNTNDFSNLIAVDNNGNLNKLLPDQNFNIVSKYWNPVMVDNFIYLYAESTNNVGLYKVDATQMQQLSATEIKNFQKKQENYAFPNPTDSVIYFNKIFKKVEVLGLDGRLLISKSNTSEINIKSLEIGNYLIKTIDNEDKVSTFKVIKKDF